MTFRLLHDSQGQRGQARTMLGLAFAGAPEPGAYARLFLAEGASMMVLLRDAAEHGTAGSHPRRLLSIASRREMQARASKYEDGTGADPGRPGAAPAQEQLSVRELQVLRLLAGELSGPEIGRALVISHNTFRTHTKHIFTKLEATTRQAAVRRARELLSGAVPDQAALHGLLTKIRDLGITLIPVEAFEVPAQESRQPR